MRTEVKELKRIARGNLQGHYLDLIRALVFCNLVISLVETPFSMMTNDVEFSTQNIIYYIAIVLISIASVVLTAGQYRLHMTLARTGEVHLSEIFEPAKNHANRFILTEVILYGIQFITLIPVFCATYIVLNDDDIKLYTFALVLALVECVLSTYVSLTFGLIYFAMNDNETLSMIPAMKFTKKLVFTHRKRYLYLMLSFLGMNLLSALSFGIASLWIEPYMVQTTTLFYLDVKGELPEVLENRKKNGPTPEPTAFNQYV